eukprot:gene4042-biopygen3986
MLQRLRFGPRGNCGQPLEENASTHTDISGVHSSLEDQRDVRDWTHPIFVPFSCGFDYRYWDPRFPAEAVAEETRSSQAYGGRLVQEVRGRVRGGLPDSALDPDWAGNPYTLFLYVLTLVIEHGAVNDEGSVVGCLGRAGRWEAGSRAHAPRTELMAGYKVKVYWSMDDAWCTGTVGDTGPDGLTHIAYEDGDEEDLDMSKEKYDVLPAAVREVAGWDAALQDRWRGELGDCSLTELAMQMKGAALGDKTDKNGPRNTPNAPNAPRDAIGLSTSTGTVGPRTISPGLRGAPGPNEADGRPRCKLRHRAPPSMRAPAGAGEAPALEPVAEKGHEPEDGEEEDDVT